MDGTRPSHGWVVLAVSLCVTTAAFGLFWSFGAFFRAWVAEWSNSQTFLSGVFTLTFPVFALSSLVMGFLTDRHGPPRALGVGGGILGAGCLMVAMSDETWMIYVGWGCMVSAGVAACLPPTLSVVTRWFASRKGLAAGVALSGFGLGTLTLSPVSELLIVSVGWRRAALLCGLIGGAVYASGALILGRAAQALGGQRPEPPNERRPIAASRLAPGIIASGAQGPSLALLRGGRPAGKTNPGHGPNRRRWTMGEHHVAALRRIRDRLSFVIFALTAKSQHKLSISNDEAAGCKEILRQTSRELLELAGSAEARLSKPIEEEIRSAFETPPQG